MKLKLIAGIILLCAALQSFAQTPGKIEQTGQVLLPNGWKLSPAGRSLPLGDLPLNMQLSVSGKLLAVTNNGQSTQSVQLIDPKNEKLLDEVVVKKSWYGLAFSRDEKKLYASGGNDNWILVFNIAGNKLGTPDTIKLAPNAWPKNKVCPTGMVTNKSNSRLYSVTKEDSTLYIIDPDKKDILKQVKLPAEAYSCILSPDEKTLYISLWGGDMLGFYNIATQTLSTIKTSSHPNELLLDKKGKFLYVADANDNAVSVVNTSTHKIIETISTALYPTRLTGSTSNGLALSPNGKTLYIANADNNCLAVFDVTMPGSSKSKGFIPVGWYPTNVKVLGNKILVSNGKGFSSMANPKGPQPVKKTDNSGYKQGAINSREQYIGGLFKGTLSFINSPSDAELKTYTKQVYANTPFTAKVEKTAKGEEGNPIPRRLGEKSPIKYVFYIIKENRTYDQVLGDMPQGNGDTSLCIFGKKVTPNHHAIANEFVLLDNFYVDAEVSADGHNWSMAAYATDFVEKTWPTSYGSRGGNYDFEGTRKAAYPRDGFIWDYCKRAGVSYRTYGEFVSDGNPGKANLKSLEGHFCIKSPGFDLNVKDVKRTEIWAHDFDSLLTINAVPHFNTVRISNDHTSGQRKGAISPIAAVADNDLAIGQFIEHLSHSSIWKESVVFILEDDAQNGPDHIDAHRSPVFVAGPYVKRNAVIHGMYSTSGVLRTIELILGLPPMSQYDAAAMPLYDCFTSKPDLTPYTAKPAQVDLEQRNIAVNESSKRSELFNFAREDAAPDIDLNEVVWKYVKGEASVMPAPKRSAFVILEPKKEQDDD
ncbi:bifunctional YncE family protein/alkaline phosphatase family protein [Mucilaginibacter rubeus]|uniref:Bifunctional YncE family protein/alkaline phosphatase family protein n=2 Tax=Mucilaginibacter TaxID=423349 RepID=A0AAE6MJN6_9SPHI|nr:bifunctional YncE family protein/alkaline phosphatase family protein [Mucilaginibacter rubeus]QEM05868.1 bifunctional YncE family protein/alkaline phosphatase family protein [Mucilaginibacter rubeus]QTE45012.1 bifunctional YncE family protein/alkaline phosphatase family protein [Mucilaginibacter rubeus]QTE51609.1 bifunctional YncE family protein/alkaline phosphatase family protein [Mucilaginibacter rubeus]QTE56696.1 bifunctional YncE family protein/alkaline phosphatase family protein [Mucila